MAEDELIKIDLKLIAAHAVIGSDQPLLQIADGPVCQSQHGLRTFAQIDSQGLGARHMLKSGFFQPGKAFRISELEGTKVVLLRKRSRSQDAEGSIVYKPMRVRMWDYFALLDLNRRLEKLGLSRSKPPPSLERCPPR